MVAPTEDHGSGDGVRDEAGANDVKGYYSDGAYTAVPVADQDSTGTKAEQQVPDDDDPQEFYRKNLFLRFRLLRANLRMPPPSTVIAALDEQHPTSFSDQQGPYFSAWRRLLVRTDPVPAQVAVMDQAVVLRLIRLSTGWLKRDRNIEPPLSRWIWALLARVEDVGCLGNDEVSVVRELGKRAVSVAMDMNQGWTGQEGHQDWSDVDEDAVAHGPEEEPVAECEESNGLEVNQAKSDMEGPSSEMDDRIPPEDQEPEMIEAGRIPTDADGVTSGDGPEVLDKEDGEVVLEEAKQRAVAQLSSDGVSASGALEEGEEAEEEEEGEEPFPCANTTATLDMIVSIVGEMFGQRDLLEFRERWE